MTKFIRSVALATAMASLVVLGSGYTVAQNAKDKKDKAEDKLGTVEVGMAKDGFRFKVVGTDGKTIMNSTKGYPTKDDALKALENAKTILNKGKVVEAK